MKEIELRCPKPHCGGRVFLDPSDDELFCINCADRWGRAGDDRWIKMGRPAPTEGEYDEATAVIYNPK